MGNLAAAYLRADRPDKAVPVAEETLAAQMRILGPDHVSTLMSMGGCGMCLMGRGDHDKARPLLQDAVDGLVRLYGEEGRTRSPKIGSAPSRPVRWGFSERCVLTPLPP